MNGDEWTRRSLLRTSAMASGLILSDTGPAAAQAFAQTALDNLLVEGGVKAFVTLLVNGRDHDLHIDTRVTLLDALREHLLLTGSKKGCDHGQCGACTVLLNGRRIYSCLTLAVMLAGDEIKTIEGLGTDDGLHPLQAAFIAHDGFQCGYCTPGQICSAVGMLSEAKAGWPSHATNDVADPVVRLTDAEIRERMSGNICRCAAYPNIVAAIRDVAERAHA